MTQKTAIEPALPVLNSPEAEDLAAQVIEASARLSGRMREPFRRELAKLTRLMHCYYSNLIEGQHTHIRDIEAALQKKFDKARGEAGGIIGTKGRQGRKILSLGVRSGLLISDTPRGAVRLGFPAKVHDTYFPRLFPAGG